MSGHTSAAQAASISRLYRTPVKGMENARAQLAEASTQIARGEVDPSTLVKTITAEHSFEANAATLRTIDRTVGVFLDTFA